MCPARATLPSFSRLALSPLAFGVMCAATAVTGPLRAGTIANPSLTAYHELLAHDDAFASVGKIEGSTATSGYTGSGVYLGDGWVLTAAHVVDQATELSFSIDGVTYDASAWAYHSDWNPAAVTEGADIALIQLDGLIGDHEAASLYTGTDEVGALGISVGYGVTGYGFTGYDPSSSTDKRAGTNTIDGVLGDDVLLSDFDSGWWLHNALGSSNATVMEYLIAPGDSGGGLFVYDPALDDWTLAGINSFGYGLDGNPDSDFGDISGQVRVSSYTDWIIDMTANDLDWTLAALSGSYSDAVFTVVPEPLVSAVPTAALLCLRRRRAKVDAFAA